MKRETLFRAIILLMVPAIATEAISQGLVHPPRTPVVAVTRHTGIFAGDTVHYSATVAETFIAGPDGSPAAIMVNTAYVRDDVTERTKRPVMFVFNGGPGASSSPLHMNAFGPRLRRGGTIADNPYSPLHSIDLVFIDPIGTGFSRPLPGIDGQPFWSVSGDAASVKTFIRSWLKVNKREESPRFLCGESYGTVRAGQILYDGHTSRDLDFDGVLLFSLVGVPSGEEMPLVNTFPTFAVTAAYHGKVDDAGRSVREIFDEAAAFARTEYIGALIQGDALPAAEEERLAQEMSRRIGLPAEFIAGKNLRISESDFMMNLLKDRGLRTGQLDTRVTGEIAVYADRQPPFDDPSMSRPATPARIKTEQSPATARSTNTQPNLVQAYMTGELNFPATESYRALNLDINAVWKFDAEGAMSSTASRIGEVMQKHPKLHLFWAAGYYDISTPLAAGKFTLDHASIPPDRMTIALFPTGHSVFEGDENLARFTDAVRDFVQNTISTERSKPN